MRGLAALMILTLHVLTWTSPAILEGTAVLPYATSLRFVAMPLFFVLSGWVIHYNFARYLPATLDLSFRRDAGNGLRFAARRLLRLYPLYVACLAIVCCYDVRLYRPAVEWDVLWRYLTLTHSWTFLTLHGVPVTQSTFSLSWSISTELALYLAYPVLGFLACRLRRERSVVLALAGTFAVAAAAAALIVTCREPIARWMIPRPTVDQINQVAAWFLHVSPWMKIWDFATGILLAQFVAVAGDRTVRLLSQRRWHGIAIALLAGFFLASSYDDIAWRTAITGALYQSCAFTPWIALLLLTAFHRPDAYRRSLLLPVGTVSYSLYLGHYVVFSFFDWMWHEPHLRTASEWLGLFIAPLAVTAAFTFVTYRLIEQPFIGLGRRLVLIRPGERVMPPSSP